MHGRISPFLQFHNPGGRSVFGQSKRGGGDGVCVSNAERDDEEKRGTGGRVLGANRPGSEQRAEGASYVREEACKECSGA